MNLSNYLTLAIALFVLAIAMLIAGVYTLTKRSDQESVPSKETDKVSMTNWMFGTPSGMDKKRAGRARITIAIIFFIAALICLAQYYFG